MKKVKFAIYCLLAMFVGSVFLSACGKKGDLYMPEKEATKESKKKQKNSDEHEYY